MSPPNPPSYDQPTKVRARRLSLAHAVELVTSRRDAADHPERVRNALLERSGRDREAGAACDPADLASWRSFRAASLGTRTPPEITVAYLAEPEPENDLEVLLELGVRPENIWAFETDKKAAAKGVDTLRRLGARGIKFIPSGIEDYFVDTLRRFDIVYVDACGPLPSRDSHTARLLMTMFRHHALAPLGVLVSNFARPDISDPDTLDRFAFLLGAYLYPKAFLESPDGGFTDGAEANGFVFNLAPEEGDDSQPSPDFRDAVKANFELYYGTFITRSLLDMAAIVAPTARMVGGNLYAVAFQRDLKAAIESGTRMVRFDEGDGEADAASAGQGEQADESPFVECRGDVISDMDRNSLL